MTKSDAIAVDYCQQPTQWRAVETTFSNAFAERGTVETIFGNALAERGTVETIFGNALAERGTVETIFSNAFAEGGTVEAIFRNVTVDGSCLLDGRSVLRFPQQRLRAGRWNGECRRSHVGQKDTC